MIRSPAEPACSLEFRIALYSAGAVGANLTLMPGFAASKAGMIFSCQICKSSFRQLSIVSVTVCAAADPMPAAKMTVAAMRTLWILPCFIIFSLLVKYIAYLRLTPIIRPGDGNVTPCTAGILSSLRQRPLFGKFDLRTDEKQTLNTYTPRVAFWTSPGLVESCLNASGVYCLVPVLAPVRRHRKLVRRAK